MTGKDMLKGIQDLDDNWIEEAEFGKVRKKKTRIFGKKKLLLLLSAIILVISLTTVCYAADLGGFRQTIQFWVHGGKTSAVMDIQNGSYILRFTDAAGKQVEVSGGGVFMNPDGTKRPLTAEDIIAHLNRPEMEYREDGTSWITYKTKVREIIDCFDTNDVCFISLEVGKNRFYITAKTGYGFMASTKGFVPPDRFCMEEANQR